MLDVVFPVRVGEPADELRYALRAVHQHVPHRRVWLIGYRPRWVVGVRHIPTVQRGTKYRNSTLAMRVACTTSEISDPFLMFNDDMFVLEPLGEGEALVERLALHRGPVTEVEAYYEQRGQGRYLQGMRQTADLLRSLGHAEPVSYELHIPMVIHKGEMLRALDLGASVPVLHKRTLYGNLAGVGGRQIDDVKVIEPGLFTPGAFLSTWPRSWWGHAGAYVRRTFTRPSPYEVR